MTKKKIWQIAGISFLCVCILAVGVLGVVFGMNHTSEPVNLATADTQEEIIECEMTYSNGIELFMSSAPVVNGDTLEQTITATVLPVNVINKEVYWSITWLNAEEEFETNNDISNYLTISATGDGSTTAKIVVHQAFAGHTALVVCRTRRGGYSATCLVNYVGIPSSITIDTSELIDGNILENTSLMLDINLDNIFHNVTDEYLNRCANFSVTIIPHGSFTAKINHLDLNNLPLDSAREITVNLEDVADVISLSAKVETGKLVITSTGSVASYHIDKIVDVSGTGLSNYREIISYLSGEENCYWDVVVTDAYSGISVTIQISVRSDIEGVELTSDELLF